MESVKNAKGTKLIEKWLNAIDRRRHIFPQLHDEHESLRLLHSETDDLRMDKVGQHIVGGWWKDTRPNEQEKEALSQFMKILGYESWCIHWRPSGGRGVEVATIDESDPAPPMQWTFKEKGVSYHARRDQGHSYGLFLDQRHNRHWLRTEAKDKKVLNLFCYTGGFSICAAVGGAHKVVSVDLRKKYLQWAEDNFVLNEKNPESEDYEFHAMDSLDYLSYAKRKELQFDIIVCDPPSFSRNRRKVFRLDKDFGELVRSCGNLLVPGGRLLFSTNYEKWSWQKWEEELNRAFTPFRGFVKTEARYGESDFETHPEKGILKSFLLTKA